MVKNCPVKALFEKFEFLNCKIFFSETSRQTILNILEQIKSLPPIERFLIYIKLNEQVSNSGDPLKQPLNPLGSRSEVCRTISWIKTHLEEDPEISLPKQQVYDEYTYVINIT